MGVGRVWSGRRGTARAFLAAVAVGLLACGGVVAQWSAGHHEGALRRAAAAQGVLAEVRRLSTSSAEVTRWQELLEVQALVEGPGEALAPGAYNRRGKEESVRRVTLLLDRLGRAHLTSREVGMLRSLREEWRGCLAQDAAFMRAVERSGTGSGEWPHVVLTGPVHEAWQGMTVATEALRDSLEARVADERRAAEVARLVSVGVAGAGVVGALGGLLGLAVRSLREDSWRAGFRPLPRARRATT